MTKKKSTLRNMNNREFFVALGKLTAAELLFFLGGFIMGIFWLIICMLAAPAFGTYWARMQASSKVTKFALLWVLVLLSIAQLIAQYISSPSDFTMHPIAFMSPAISIIIFGYISGLVGEYFANKKMSKPVAR